MTRTAWWIAAGAVVISNLAAVGGAALNRRGEPEATLVLTERELRLPPRQAENTALTLRLNWIDGSDSDRHVAWLDRAKLEEIGFDCTLPLTEENLSRYRSLPPRSAYAVLEYDGEAWRRYEEKLRAEQPPGTTSGILPPDARDAQVPRGRGNEREVLLRGSRFVVVDIGKDPVALRQHYADRGRSVVVPASVAVRVMRNGNAPASLSGRVVSIHPQQLNVPSRVRKVLEPLQAAERGNAPSEPRYRVTVNWGRRAPWIADVRPIEDRP